MQTNSTTEKPPVAKAFDGVNCNTFFYCWNLKAKLDNGRFSMKPIIVPLIWDLTEYSMIRLLVLVNLLNSYIRANS